jgi:hypothetical protein
VQVPDSPGGLASVLERMTEQELSIEYLYAFLGTRGDDALVIFKVEDIAKARKIFNEKGIKFLDESTLYKL